MFKRLAIVSLAATVMGCSVLGLEEEETSSDTANTTASTPSPDDTADATCPDSSFDSGLLMEIFKTAAWVLIGRGNGLAVYPDASDSCNFTTYVSVETAGASYDELFSSRKYYQRKLVST